MAVTNYYTVNGEIIGEKAGAGARTDYLTDALGNVTATMNQSAAIVNTYRYKPYGGLLAKIGVGADPAFTWVGSQGYRQTSKKYSDVYIRARHDDTLNGRWTTKDPIGFAGGDWGFFRYALSTPVWLVDPTGNKPNCVTFCIDDSPDDNAARGTRHILAVLKNGGRTAKDIKAYFFVIGLHVDEFPSETQALLDAGQIIGNHTQNHPQPFSDKSSDVMYDEFCKVHGTMQDKFKLKMSLYRAPGESRDETGNPKDWDRIDAAAKRFDSGYKALMDPTIQRIFTVNDKLFAPTPENERKVLDQAKSWLNARRGGNVILCFHDPMVSEGFLRKLIDWLDANGIPICNAT
jgi:RHS repeat-associated protein